MTTIVDRLVEHGDAVRTEDEHDRRVTRIMLTPQGKRVFEKNKSAIFEAFNKRSSVLSASELAELSHLLRKLSDADLNR
jgi:DNA-binding MarR family transcriptional regulator